MQGPLGYARLSERRTQWDAEQATGSPGRTACLLDPAGGDAYGRPGDRADITLIL
jgi:hypothetical protein